jgi:predicted DNA binding CopG/RHH family protein
MDSLNSLKKKKLLESVEQEEWESVPNVSQEIKRYQTYASHQINQQRIEVTLSVEDSQKIQQLS